MHKNFILWKGIFEYSIEIQIECPYLKPIQFYLLSCKENILDGVIYDIGGMLCPAKVSGYINEDEIYFEKQYNYYHIYDRDTYQQQILNFKPPIIYYKGILNDLDEFEGTWEHKVSHINYSGEIIKYEGQTGTFKIWRNK